jgi:hypothetical protein
MDTTNKGIDPSEYLKKIFNCPEDDWGAVKFGGIKERFLTLVNREDTDGVLLELAKAYSTDATKSFMQDELREHGMNMMESMSELGNIAAMGFILMGVYYGYLLKQKELRDRPLLVDWGFLNNIKSEEKKEQKEKNEDTKME